VFERGTKAQYIRKVHVWIILSKETYRLKSRPSGLKYGIVHRGEDTHNIMLLQDLLTSTHMVLGRLRE
jgi:hypothetical protein